VPAQLSESPVPGPFSSFSRSAIAWSLPRLEPAGDEAGGLIHQSGAEV
jgi:hypothetical protein